jgi:dipeptidyl aminopeptidase/acylaminoacyl peptidase
MASAGGAHGPFVLSDDASVLYFDVEGGEAGHVAIASLDGVEAGPLDLGEAALREAGPVVGIADGVLLFMDAEDELMAAGWDSIAKTTTGRPIPVPGIPGGLRHAALAEDGALAMLVGPEAYDLLVVDDRGYPEFVLSGDRVTAAYPRFSPDGSKLALVSDLRGGGPELWSYDLETGLMAQLSLGVPPLGGVAWSADGLGVFGAPGYLRTATGEIRSRPADGGEPATSALVANGWQLRGLDLSPDQRTLVLAATRGGGPDDPTDIFARGLAGDTSFTPVVATASSEVAPRLSPDGRWLAYASDESGVFQVYAVPFPGPGPRVQVSSAGGGQPVWSADGGRLFYVTEDAIVAALIENDGRGAGLSVTGREQLFRGDFLGGPAGPVATFDVHPDGRRFVVTRAPGSASTEIILWMDWLAELKESLAEGIP